MQLQSKKGFTLVELLVVMMVISVLAGLILYILPYVHNKEARTRAEAEIKGMASALESYKADNGSYPDDAILGAGFYTKGKTDNLDARMANDPTSTADPSNYAAASLVLYRALSGDRNLDRKIDRTGSTDLSLDLQGQSLASPLAEPPTTYYPFPTNMLLPPNGTGTVTGVVDPFGYYYGYSTAYQGDIATGNNPPTRGYNATYDFWSTGGTVAKGSDSPTQISNKRSKWLINWQNSGANSGQ